NVALLGDPRELALQARQLIRGVRLSARAGKRARPLGIQLGGPLVQPVARDPQLACDLGGWPTRLFEQLDGFKLKFFGKPLALAHRPPPPGTSCPLSRCPSNQG